MSLPREVIPGRFYMITRRCTQRQFLLRPDEETNNAFVYCLAEAAQRCNIAVLLTCAMSGGTDPRLIREPTASRSEPPEINLGPDLPIASSR